MWEVFLLQTTAFASTCKDSLGTLVARVVDFIVPAGLIVFSIDSHWETSLSISLFCFCLFGILSACNCPLFVAGEFACRLMSLPIPCNALPSNFFYRLSPGKSMGLQFQRKVPGLRSLRCIPSMRSITSSERPGSPSKASRFSLSC